MLELEAETQTELVEESALGEFVSLQLSSFLKSAVKPQPVETGWSLVGPSGHETHSRRRVPRCQSSRQAY